MKMLKILIFCVFCATNSEVLLAQVPVPASTQIEPTLRIPRLDSLRSGTFEKTSKIRAHFTWEMEARYGLDTYNNNGLIDLPNSREYVNPNLDINGNPRFNVTFHFAFGDGYESIHDDLRLSNNSVKRINKYQEWTSKSNIELISYSLTLDRDTELNKGPISESNLNQDVTIPLTEGWHTLTLRVNGLKDGKNVFNSYSEDVFIDDVLIVAMGDSYSSGEGNPERSKQQGLRWADGAVSMPPIITDAQSAVENNMSIQHHAAHRSTLCWSSQAAIALEKRHKHTSVTYVLVASSGATIKNGIIGTQKVKILLPGEVISGDEPLKEHEGPSKILPTQISQVSQIVRNKRTIDLLPISIGGNDIGFSKTIATLLLRDPPKPWLADFERLKSAVKTGKWDDWEDWGWSPGDWNPFNLISGHAVEGNVVGLDNLSAEFSKLKNAIDVFNVGNVYILEYPYAFTEKDENGNIVNCEAVLKSTEANSLPGDYEVGKHEQKWMKDNVFGPLNDQLENICERFNWPFISGTSAAFEGHFLCESLPYSLDAYPGNPFPSGEIDVNFGLNSRWYRRYRESFSIQNGKNGTAHPNEFGHQAIKNQFLSRIKPRQDKIVLNMEETTHLVGDVAKVYQTSLVPSECVNEYDMEIKQQEYYDYGGKHEVVYSSIPSRHFSVNVQFRKNFDGSLCNNCPNIEILPGEEKIIQHVSFKRDFEHVNIKFLDQNDAIPYCIGADCMFEMEGLIKNYLNEANIVIHVKTDLFNGEWLEASTGFSKTSSSTAEGLRRFPDQGGAYFDPEILLIDPIRDRLFFVGESGEMAEFNGIYDAENKLKKVYSDLLRSAVIAEQEGALKIETLKEPRLRRDLQLSSSTFRLKQRSLSSILGRGQNTINLEAFNSRIKRKN